MIKLRRLVLPVSKISHNLVPRLGTAAMSTGNCLEQSKKLEGKVAIVTASTEGIGFAIAKGLGENGAKVIVSSRKEARVIKATKLLKDEGFDVQGTVCHVGQAEDRKKLVDFAISHYGGLDILVSNAGTNPTFGAVLDTQEASWDKIFDTNVKSSFLMTQECAPHLTEKGGSIVFVSSIAGYQPMPGLGAYSVSKTALLGLTKVLANELGSSNVRVNCIAPGVIQTSFSKMLWTNEDIKNEVIKQVPLGRFGDPSDCVGAIVFLCSDDAKYITGETIPITGGMMSRL